MQYTNVLEKARNLVELTTQGLNEKNQQEVISKVRELRKLANDLSLWNFDEQHYEIGEKHLWDGTLWEQWEGNRIINFGHDQKLNEMNRDVMTIRSEINNTLENIGSNKLLTLLFGEKDFTDEEIEKVLNTKMPENETKYKNQLEVSAKEVHDKYLVKNGIHYTIVYNAILDGYKTIMHENINRRNALNHVLLANFDSTCSMIVNSFRRKYTEPHTNCSTTTDDYNKQLFINKSKLDNTEFQGFIGADEAFRKQDLNLETEIGKSVMELIAKMIKYVWKKEILQRLQELYKLRDEELQTFREAVESLAKMESELVFKTGDGPYEAEIKELEDKLELI